MIKCQHVLMTESRSHWGFVAAVVAFAAVTVLLVIIVIISRVCAVLALNVTALS